MSKRKRIKTYIKATSTKGQDYLHLMHVTQKVSLKIKGMSCETLNSQTVVL